jgi:hypothetical protein
VVWANLGDVLLRQVHSRLLLEHLWLQSVLIPLRAGLFF